MRVDNLCGFMRELTCIKARSQFARFSLKPLFNSGKIVREQNNIFPKMEK